MGLFDNAESVMVNNKEVQSIIDSNGGVLYEKVSPQSLYVLTVTSDKDILSYYDNDVATLTATLTQNGVPVQGEEVIFHTKETVIYSSGDTITLNEGEEILIPKNAQFNIDTGTNGSGDYFHWNNGDFEYGNINGDITITSSARGRTITVPKVFGTLNTVSSVTIKKMNGEYIVEDSNSDLVVEYSPNYDNGIITTNLEIELGREIDTISLITNNNGIVTYQYNSQGIGDITFDISCMNLQETYSIEDCDYYSPTPYSSDVSLNIPVTSKNACTVELDIIKSASNNGAFLKCGTDSNNYIGVGLISSGNYGFILQHNNSRVTTQISSGLGNGTFHAVLTYDNGSITVVMNNQTKTYTYTQPIDCIVGTGCWNSGQLKNIKVKPL